MNIIIGCLFIVYGLYNMYSPIKNIIIEIKYIRLLKKLNNKEN